MKKKLIIFFLLVLANPLTALAIEVPNPLDPDGPTGVTTVEGLINNIIRAFLGISGALALFFVFQGGITWMMSRGNSEKVKSGKDMIVWAIFGLVAIFMSYVVINVVLESLEGFRS